MNTRVTVRLKSDKIPPCPAGASPEGLALWARCHGKAIVLGKPLSGNCVPSRLRCGTDTRWEVLAIDGDDFSDRNLTACRHVLEMGD
jgi:hypothetical protein